MRLCSVNLNDLSHWLQPDKRLYTERFFMSAAPDFPLRLQKTTGLEGVTPDQVVQLSSLFLAERRERLGKKLQPGENATSGSAKFLFLPLSAPVAMYDNIGNTPYCLFSLGLFELLQYQATVSVWYSLVEPKMRRLQLDTTQLKSTSSLLNLRSVLFLMGETPLLPIAAHLPEKLLQQGHILAEVASAFLLQHEIGHAVFAANGHASHHKQQIPLYRPETLNSQKEEEFFADRYALENFPAQARAVVLEAATVVFNLMAYIDGLEQEASSRQHPLTINRLHYLAKHLPTNPNPDAGESLQRAIASISTLSEQIIDSRYNKQSLLRTHSHLIDKVDWVTTLTASAMLLDN